MKVYYRAQFVTRENIERVIEARDMQEAHNIWRAYEEADGRKCEGLQIIPDWKYDAIMRLERAEKEHRDAENALWNLGVSPMNEEADSRQLKGNH
ncbi:MAG TPA: hypothetical protein PLG60_08160 [Acidimicrobiales bacterium]|nr:hypothetical protein [Acidimicrobiales bacterium]